MDYTPVKIKLNQKICFLRIIYEIIQPLYVSLLGTSILSQREDFNCNSHARPVQIVNFIFTHIHTHTLMYVGFVIIFTFAAKIIVNYKLNLANKFLNSQRCEVVFPSNISSNPRPSALELVVQTIRLPRLFWHYYKPTPGWNWPTCIQNIYYFILLLLMHRNFKVCIWYCLNHRTITANLTFSVGWTFIKKNFPYKSAVAAAQNIWKAEIYISVVSPKDKIHQKRNKTSEYQGNVKRRRGGNVNAVSSAKAGTDTLWKPVRYLWEIYKVIHFSRTWLNSQM